MPQNQEKPNGTSAAAVNHIVKQHRYSLQHKPNDIPLDNFRHTQSHRYDSEGKRKTKKATVLSPIQATINEGSDNENDERFPEKKSEQVFSIENEKRISKSSKKSEKNNYAYENGGYDSSMDKRSISSRAGSSRQPSVQSLEVVREQYCCCAKRTRCEKKLLLTVTVLSLVIIVLAVVLAVVASHRDIRDDLKTLTSKF